MMMTKHIPVALLPCFLLLSFAPGLCPDAPADVILVPEDYALVQDALDAAQDDDTVSVAPGSYDEYVRIEAKRITLTSRTGPEDTFIDDFRIVTVDAPGPTIEGLSFRHGYFDHTAAVFDGNVVHEVDGAGGGVFCWYCGSDLVIRGNRFLTSISSAITISYSHPTVENNLFTYSDSGVGQGAAIDSYSSVSGPMVIVNNTFDGRGAGGGGIDLYCDSGAQVLLANNIIVNYERGIDVRSPQQPLVSLNNLVWNNSQGNFLNATVPGVTDLSVPPLLTPDGHLQAGSVCIDSGNDSDPAVPDDDIDGQARPMGPGVDRGADEYDPSSPPAAEDLDADGVLDPDDNCPADSNPLQEDEDGDDWGDACDRCPGDPNPIEQDMDQDGLGDHCDNCPVVPNPVQEDLDEDGEGDICDDDDDGDGAPDPQDNCPVDYNPGQRDMDWDGTGNVCDNCLSVWNPEQRDLDEDGTGDACDIDVDGDDVPNGEDNCPIDYNPTQDNPDGDDWGNPCDHCPDVPDPYNEDSDSDGVGDVCDNCPARWNSDQEDLDGDGAGDACDRDVDGDGHGPGIYGYDCDDRNPSIYPGAPDTPGDGIDSNCNNLEECFIATAAFGSPLEPRIDVLRSFRDRVLMKSRAGRLLVDFYYEKSPPLARYIERHAFLRGAVRILLMPVIGLAHFLV